MGNAEHYTPGCVDNVSLPNAIAPAQEFVGLMPPTGFCWHCNHLRETKLTKRGWCCTVCGLSMVANPTGKTSVYGNRGAGETKPAYSPAMVVKEDRWDS